ncbi:hypothetical protein BS78_05G127700 [Paspalum vaginatum]|nr:hypothetical protein BS78_05G127700 [Paspalum vaginatum]
MLFLRHLLQQHKTFCLMCNSQSEETINHLFFECEFPKQCWAKLHISWVHSSEVQERIQCTLQASTLPYFHEISIIAMWELWKLRNRKVFDSEAPLVRLWILRFKEEVSFQSLRIKESSRPAALSWLQSL